MLVLFFNERKNKKAPSVRSDGNSSNITERRKCLCMCVIYVIRPHSAKTKANKKNEEKDK
jgi:hypothetical protein